MKPTIVVLVLVSFGQESESIDGHWLGTLNAGGTKLRIVIHVEKKGGTLDSPDQGAKGIPLSDVALEGKTVRVRGLLIKHGRFGYEIIISEKSMILSAK